MELEITTISDDPLIRGIFKYELWNVDEGIDYLVGIYKVFKVAGVHHVTTIDGRLYHEPEHEKEIAELFELYDQARDRWDHSKKKQKRYYPSTFIKWGLENRDVARVPWIIDAEQKGLVTLTIDNYPVQPEKGLISVERESMLKIIAGLALKAYSAPIPKYGIQKQINKALNTIGLEISSNTLSKYLKEAWELLPDEVKQAKNLNEVLESLTEPK